MNSALYVGRVAHRRSQPIEHSFAYGHFLLCLDLSEIEHVFDGRWLWSTEHANLVSWRRRDYLGDSSVSLREAVLERVFSALGRRPDGSIFQLTQPRLCGFVFNPVSFYYCYDAQAQLDAVVAEITNTPWKERHAYVLDARGSTDAVRARFAKRFHVSPFLPMQQTYEWCCGELGRRWSVRMDNFEGDTRVFEATMELERRPLDGRELAWALLRWPGFSLRSLAAIYWQALRLKGKGAPFFDHPGSRSPRTETASR